MTIMSLGTCVESGAATESHSDFLGDMPEGSCTTAEIIQFPENYDDSSAQLDDFIDELSQKFSDFEEEMFNATKWAAKSLYNSDTCTLAKLRMSHGLSQKNLASSMNTSQSQLSRIESGCQDPTLSTIESIASVLGEDIGVVVQALQGSRK